MNILLDTHFILWILTDETKLSKKEKEIIENPKNSIICSSISFFEISLKYSIGKLILERFTPEDIPDLMLKNGYEIVDISYKTFSTYYKLPNDYHKDPFDRLLIWEAIQNNYKLLTRDANIKEFKSLGLKLL